MELQETTVEEQEQATPKRPKGRWKRILKRVFLGTLVLLVLGRLALPFVLPKILNRVAAKQGLRLNYEDLDLSILTGSLELWHVSVEPLGSPEDIAEESAENEAQAAASESLELRVGDTPTQMADLEFLLVDVDVSALFTGTLLAHRVEIDGLDLYARRDGQTGAWQWEGLPAFQTAAEEGDEEPDGSSESEAESAEDAEPGAEAAEPVPFDWDLGFQVAAVRLQHLQLHVLDETQSPALRTTLECNVRLSDLGHPERPTRFELFAHAGDLLDLISVRGTLNTDGANLDALLNLDVRGLRAQPLSGYLEPLGVEPRARQVDMALQLTLHTESTNESQTELRLQAQIEGMSLVADGVAQVAIDTIEVDLPSVSRTSMRAETVLIRGVRGQAQRDQDGNLVVGGFALLPVAKDSEPETEVQETLEDSPASGPALALDIPEVRLEQAELEFHDRAVRPPATLALQIPNLTLGPILRGPGVQPPPIFLRGQILAPGLWEDLQLDGQVQAFADTQGAELELSIDGLTLEAAKPYLLGAGMEPRWESANLKARLSASSLVQADGARNTQLELSQVSLEDGSVLFGIEGLSLKNFVSDPASGDMHIGELSISGTEVHLRRDEQGIWNVLGLALVPPAGSPGPAAGAASTTPAGNGQGVQPTPDAPKPGPPPVIALEHLLWSDTSIHLQDDWLQPAVNQTFDGVRLELHSLVLGGDPAGPERGPAEFSLALTADRLAERLALAGSVQSQPGALDLDLQAQVTGEGMQLTALEPWLQPLGLESQWDGAQLGLEISAQVQEQAEGMRLALELSDLSFENQGETWLQLASIQVPQILIEDKAIRIDPISMQGPRLRLKRDAEGILEVMGLRLLPAPELSAEQLEQQASVVEAESELAESGAGPEAPEVSTEAPSAEPADPTVVHLPSLVWQGIGVDWSDASMQPPLDAQLDVQLELRDWMLGAMGEKPGSLTARVSVPGAVDELVLQASVLQKSTGMDLTAQVSADGLRAGSLEPYLPAGLSVSMQNGQLRWQIEGGLHTLPEGGQSMALRATDLILRDGPEGDPLLALDRLALEVPRSNWEGGDIEIEELTLTGLRTALQREDGGAWNMLGVRFDPALAGGQNESEVAAEPQPDSGSAGTEDASVPPLVAGGGSRRLPKLNREALPWIRLNQLDVGIESLRFQDGSSGVPLELALRLHSEQPLVLLSPEPIELEPLRLRVEGAALPLVDAIESDLTLSPYAVDPSLEAVFAMRGIRGTQVARVLPSLKDKLIADEWTDGELRARVQAEFAIRRRSPIDFPLQDGFGLELLVDQVLVRAHPEATEKLGMQELQVLVASIKPKSGDVHVRQVEWVGPFAEAWKDAEGMHFADLVWKATPMEEVAEAIPEPEEVPLAQIETGEEVAEVVPVEGANSPVADAPVAGAPDAVAQAIPIETGPEIKVDEVLISGGRLRFEDRSVDPVLVFPVADMDFEAKRFSTRTLVEERPFRFALSLYGGQVELPERDLSANLVTGLLGSVTALATGKGDFEIEERPVFDEFRLRGNMSLGPQPKGWVQLRVRAFELPILRGLASQSGVDIGDGLLDQSARANFDGKGNLRISSATNFSYLSLSEPAGGPISSYLKLPAPLDTVLFVLKDRDGDQSIPLNLGIMDGSASMSQVLGAVTTALGTLIGEAIAGSPMRIVGGVTDLIGLGPKPIELTGDEWVRLPYSPGEMQATEYWAKEIDGLVKLLRKDSSLYLVVDQVLGQEDVDHASMLANPDPQQCFALAASYRRERGDLIVQRDRIADAVRLAYALGNTQQAETKSIELRLLDAEMARTEEALDRVLERSQDRGARARQRRTKDAALELTRRRQALLSERLNTLAVAGMQTRLDLRRPRFVVQEDAETGFVQIQVQRRR